MGFLLAALQPGTTHPDVIPLPPAPPANGGSHDLAVYIIVALIALAVAFWFGVHVGHLKGFKEGLRERKPPDPPQK